MEPPPWWDGGVDPPVPSVMPSPSHGTYTPGVLRLYDAWVLTLSNRWVWRCPSDPTPYQTIAMPSMDSENVTKTLMLYMTTM